MSTTVHKSSICGFAAPRPTAAPRYRRTAVEGRGDIPCVCKRIEHAIPESPRCGSAPTAITMSLSTSTRTSTNPLRPPARRHSRGGPQIFRLRRPGPRFCQDGLRPLPPGIPAGLLLQEPLVLSLLPPEKCAIHRSIHPGPGAGSRCPPTLCLGDSGMLRPYFQRHRHLLKRLCALAHESLAEYLRTALDCPQGVPAVVLTLHTFGHCQLSRLRSDCPCLGVFFSPWFLTPLQA